MENKYRFFKRDISWLSFNYRVLLEAEDENLPLYERINFISIYTSNLEEFYKVRVADQIALAMGLVRDEVSTAEDAAETLAEINKEVKRQGLQRKSIYKNLILPEMRKQKIIFYQNRQEVEPVHVPFISNFFREEIFPFLQPVPARRDKFHTFIRDNRLYMAIRLKPKNKERDPYEYFYFKLPYSKVPRFIELPKSNGYYYLMFIEDIIKMNVDYLFPGYDVDSQYCFKISRDADIYIDDVITRPGAENEMADQLKMKVSKRKIGAVCRFVYDSFMPQDFLECLSKALDIDSKEWVPGDRHLNLEDLSSLPCPRPELKSVHKPGPLKLSNLKERGSVFRRVNRHDLLLFYPYHSFNHFIDFLYEAVHDPACKEIMLTQYRVAENSAVINTLIAAAQNGKKVTVFVELKARFDEENNLTTAKMMEAAGIHIIFSIPKLKVHAKVALVLRRDKEGKLLRSYGYISTGNFNEDTARVYADAGLFVTNPTLINDLHNLFLVLQRKVEQPVFKSLLVARFNLIPCLKKMIQNEIRLAQAGLGGRIILKMNALQDPLMIEELYKASEAGVQIDLIVRGICCLIPGQEFSRNIRITRIVDSFLEHARVWYFGNNGKPRVFLGSPDWMRRNLYRRIEAVTPVLQRDTKQQLIDMLDIELNDNVKACWIDENLQNNFKIPAPGEERIRSQYAFYEYLRKRKDQD